MLIKVNKAKRNATSGNTDCVKFQDFSKPIEAVYFPHWIVLPLVLMRMDLLNFCMTLTQRYCVCFA